MKNLIVYSSLTGNTQKVGEAIFEIMPEGTRISPVETAPAANEYDFVSVGFWVDKGTADKKTLEYIETIRDRKVALFATLGAKADSPHAQECLEKVARLLDKSNALVGTFICQGKIDPKLTEAMKNFPKGHFHEMTTERQALHNEAAKHPDAKDLAEAQKTFMEMLTKF